MKRALRLSILLAVMLAPPAADAQVARSFAARFTYNGAGSITLTGNTLMFPGGGGGGDNNDNKTMVYADVDGDATTFSSSTATLTLPAGASVLWAGLYWGGVSANAARNTIRLAAPGGGYATYTAAQLDAIGNVYQGFVNVTSLVTAAGSGLYRAANVYSTPNTGDVWAGWAIVVAYRLSTITPRNLVVADGFLFCRPGNPLNFTVNGFLTPPTGTIQTSVGTVAYDGDNGFQGEDFILNTTTLSDALNPANNVFNSSLTLLGAAQTGKNPDLANNWGFDADILAANGVLANGSSSATITLQSASDRYYPGVLTFNTEIYLPRFDAASFTKTVTDLNGGVVAPGDILEYLVTATNTGTDAATQTVVRDTLPANATYVAGSMQVVSGPNAGAKTDAAADDQMDYAAASRTVVARIGTGANGTTGGTLGIGVASAVRFRVQVTPPAPTGTVVSNQAAISCVGQIQGIAVNERSDGDAATAGVQPTVVTTTSYPLSGTVFEDVNYGGGAGRSRAAAGGAPVRNARVELYDAAGNFDAAAATDSLGRYTFDGWSPGLYQIRVVNGSVASTRPGSIAGLVPVQTWRTDATSGAPAAVSDRVGGESPWRLDPAANLTNANLSTLGTSPYTVQSLSPATLGGAALGGIDFGFNFSTIVNVNDAGQGSLRQFLLNADALGNGGLAQSGLTAGIETSIFMISDGLAHPGLRAGPLNQLGNGVARVLVLSALPAITDAVRLDGGTQTANVGNTNATTLGAGGTAGASALALTTVVGPEVEIRDAAGVAIGLDVQASSVTLGALAVRGFGNAAGSDADADVRVGAGANGTAIQACVFGTSATSFADSGAAMRSGGDHVRALGGDNGTISGSLIGFGAGSGIALTGGSNGWQLTSLEVRGNSIGNPARAAIAIESSGGVTAQRLLVAAHAGAGIDAGTSTGANAFTECTVTGNGTGAGAVTAGLRLGGANGTVDHLIVRGNYGAGVMVAAGATNQVVTHSLFGSNGTVAGAGAPSGQIGIDLLAAADNAAAGTAPFVTRNDLNDADAGGNGLVNFPVLQSVVMRNGNVTFSGWSRPGAIIEVFVDDGDPSGFGEGTTWVTAFTEGSGADLDGATSAYAPPVNGLDQGSDNTNRFRFTLPIPAGVAPGVALTATGTVAGAGTSEFSGRVRVTSGVDVNGFAYADLDHDLVHDPAEVGTATALYAKLVASGASSATQVAAADPATGAYLLSFVNGGTYDIVLDTNANPNDVTPGYPAGWIGTEAPAGVRAGVAVAGTDLWDQNFGLWHGARADGRVFRDDGAGGGIANDGLAEGAEAGVAGARVRLAAPACAGGVCDSATTGASGAYSLWVPFAATGASANVQESNLLGWISTGGSPGATGGSYARAADATTYTPVAGAIAGGADFGDVPPNTFASPGAQSVFPGGFTAYAHRFTARSAGSVVFSSTETPSPAVPGWSLTVIRDLNCNGVDDPGEPVVSGSIALATGEQVCLVARHVSPPGAPVGALETASLSASFTCTGAAPPLGAVSSLDDVTTVTAHGLAITKSVSAASAKPGDLLTYTIQYTNLSSQPLSGIVIHDATPAYTIFGAAACGALGSGLTGCGVVVQPAPGASGPVQWALAGALAPGASGSVTFVVRVQ